jgi:hypothetical protein
VPARLVGRPVPPGTRRPGRPRRLLSAGSVTAAPGLEDVVTGSELVFPVRRLAADGLAAWEQVIERGYEGLVAEDEASVYEPGPTRRWLKVKVPGWTVEEDRWQQRILLIAGRGGGWLAG